MVHSNIAFLKDFDRKVKVYLNGTAVSNSSLQSQYAKYLNFLGNYSIASNDTLGAYDITNSDDGKIIAKLGGSNVGTGAALYPNFINDFNVVVNSSNYDISLKYPNRVLSNVNTIPRKLNFGTGITATENVSNDTIDMSVPGVSPVTSRKWGLFSGGARAVSGTSTLGSGFMNGWKTSGAMNSKADSDGSYMQFQTTTSSDNAVYYTGDDNTSYIFPAHNPTFWVKFKIPDITSTDMYCGFLDFTPPLPTNSADYLKGTSNRGFGLTFDVGSWTTYHLMWNNQAANSSIADTTVTAVNNNVVTAKIFCDFANSRWGVSVNGGTPIYVASTDTNFPIITGHTYGFILQYQNESGVQRLFNCYYLYGETDL